MPFLTNYINEADLIVGKIAKRQRAEFELRRHKLKIRPLDEGCGIDETSHNEPLQGIVNIAGPSETKGRKAGGNQRPVSSNDTNGLIQVVKLSWLTDCLAQQRLLPCDKYLLFQGVKLVEEGESHEDESVDQESSIAQIFQRGAVADGGRSATSNNPSYVATQSGAKGIVSSTPTPSLLRQTTPEHEGTAVFPNIVPGFLHTQYSCQRPTPMDPPNGNFIEELKRIRTFRLLQGDKIGVRAYSTSIATLSAYPYTIQNPTGES